MPAQTPAQKAQTQEHLLNYLKGADGDFVSAYVLAKKVKMPPLNVGPTLAGMAGRGELAREKKHGHWYYAFQNGHAQQKSVEEPEATKDKPSQNHPAYDAVEAIKQEKLDGTRACIELAESPDTPKDMTLNLPGGISITINY